MKKNQSLSNNKDVRRISLGAVISILSIVVLLSSCKSDNSFYDLFPNNPITLEGVMTEFDTHGNVEDLYCNDSVLIAYNSGLNKSFTMYDLKTGNMVNEFGVIGHGHNEIPKGCFGGIFGNSLVVSKDVNKVIARFSLMKERNNCFADTIITYKLDETMLSQIVPVDSECYLGLGAYQWNKHYVIFDTKGHVYDSTTPLYNANDEHFNKFTKFLSNQGVIIRHPIEDKYVGTTNNSSIIDFMKIKDNHIYHIKGYHNILPSWETKHSENMNITVWTDNTINGFLDLSGNEKNVFALYSEATMKEREYISDNILVFDWEGNPKNRIILDKFVKQIAVNNNTIFSLSEDERGNQYITAYNLGKLNIR